LAEKRRQWPDQCPDEYKSLKDWNRRWNEFIYRRNYLKEKGIIAYFKRYYTDPKTRQNYIIDRFFEGIPEHMIEDNIRQMVYRWIGNGNDFNINLLPDYLQDILFPPGQQQTYTNYLGII
jgi:hypothetical protein